MAEGEEGAGAPGAGGEEAPNEEELREQLEEEIKKVRVEDVVLQSVVSILNLTARRIAKDEERDLEQAKIGIDAASALTDLVKPEAQQQLRQAVSELQLLYSKHAGEGEPPAAEETGGAAPEEEKKPQDQGKQGESKLWTPGS